MKVLDNDEEPKSILSLIPKRQCPRPCCFAAMAVKSTGNKLAVEAEHHPAVAAAATGEDSPPAVTDYEVYQTPAQKKRFQSFCKAPWFPVDESTAPLFEAVRSLNVCMFRILLRAFFGVVRSFVSSVQTTVGWLVGWLRQAGWCCGFD